MRTVDEVEVVVVGAGPAGSSCAAALAEAGHDVLVVDQSAFPRPKACGDGLGPLSVSALDRLGLESLVESARDVTAIRFVRKRRRPIVKGYDQPAKCLGRDVLDMAILDAALDRGARFLQGRVDRPLVEDGTIEGVVLRNGAEEAAVRARCVVAADGTTSRLRRTTGSRQGPGVRAKAIRQYVQTTEDLAPTFDFFSLRGVAPRGVVGYGWVFPIGPKLANIGVGYYDDNGAVPSLRDALAAFARQLTDSYGHMYGGLEPVDRPMGAYLGVGDSIERYQLQRILFVGDASRMTDPISGEGIANALRGGALVAEIAGEALANGRGAEWHFDGQMARRMRHEFLRLNRNTGLVRRLAARQGPAATRQPLSRARDRAPYLRSIARSVVAPDEKPTLAATPVGALLADLAPEAGRALDAVNELALETLQVEMPFATETLHRKLRADDGPITAATLLLCAQLGGKAPDQAVTSAAVGVELLSLLPLFAGQTVDGPGQSHATINNALAFLTADFAAVRALRCGMAAGSAIAGSFARTGSLACEGELMARVGSDPLTSGDSARYVKAAALARGSLYELAAVTGAGFGTKGPERTIVAAFGRALGVAAKAADDGCEMRLGDRRLPVIRDICRSHVEAAQTELSRLDGADALRALSDLPLARLRSRELRVQASAA